MVSRRNFFTMALTMLILLFIFQFTGMAQNVLNEYDKNEYTDSFPVQYGADSMYRADYHAGAADAGDKALGERPYILFIGGDGSEDIRSTVQWWCTYTKRGVEECADPARYVLPAGSLPQAAVIDGGCLDLQNALPVLEKLAGEGVHLIFARLPETDLLAENQAFMKLLGIEEIRQKNVELSGIHLFSGFLLGKERVYEYDPDDEDSVEIEMEVPWYVTGSGTKTYLMGMVGEEDEYKNEILPAIIWRNSVQGARVFCVNADFISHMYGIGFLNAMMADADLYELYPVVNAQNMSIVNFSGFADENEDVLMKLYSEPNTAMYRELVWPTLASAAYKCGSKMTLLASPQFDYADEAEPDVEKLVYFMKLLKEQHGEMGISMDSVSSTKPDEKISKDQGFFREAAETYDILCLYTKEVSEAERLAGRQPFLSKVRTVTALPEAGGPVLDYLGGSLTIQGITSLAEKHTYKEDLELLGMETALGYSNVALDLQKVAYPASEDYYWEKLSRTVPGNIYTYWKDFDGFAETTLTESDARVRRFLAMDFRAEQRDNKIVIKRNHADGSVWFLLKLNGMTIKEIEGGAYEKQSGGYYLIEMYEQEAEIELKER